LPRAYGDPRSGTRPEARRLLLAGRAAAPEIAEVSALTGAEARELFPPLRPDLAAVFIGGGRVDGRLLAAVGPDERPLLGPVAGVDGLVVATGLGHSGLTMGPHAGAIAARVALGEPPGLDLAPLDPLRA
jgi:glycine/D-amino acid oxidase-like deaminating enzyme